MSAPATRQHAPSGHRPTASSSASSSTSGAKPGAGNRAAARDLLRDYYGLSKAGPAKGAQAQKGGDQNVNPLDLDSPSFSAPVYMEKLLNTSTLAQLLKASTELSSSIGELETERQNLVYNHHHELIDASVTISKMKVRAESLDTTLEQLKAGLSKCSELNNGLRIPLAKDSRAEGAASDSQAEEDIEPSTARVAMKTRPPPDWQTVLGTIIDLPYVMREASPEEAQRLWGTYEPVLRLWKDAGVQGIQEIEAECRQCLNGQEG